MQIALGQLSGLAAEALSMEPRVKHLVPEIKTWKMFSIDGEGLNNLACLAPS